MDQTTAGPAGPAAQVARLRDGVRRRAFRRFGLPLPPRDRRRLAVAAVRAVERLEPALAPSWRPRLFWADDRVLVRPDLGDEVRAMLPSPRHTGPGRPAGATLLPARVSADALVLAKLDTRRGVKLRAAYAGSGLTLAVQPLGPRGVNGITKVVQAHTLVDAHAPGLMPRLRAHGVLPDGLRYLVEDWVRGSVARTVRELDGLVPAVLAGLARVHDGHGVRRVCPSELWGPQLVSRWQETELTGVLPAAVADRVRRLLLRDRSVRVSWTHGDLVPSNVLSVGDGVVLLDWERSGETALMNDPAKLHLFSPHPATTLAAVLDAWPTTALPGWASPAEELALAHAQLIGRYPSRRRGLARHPRRRAVYERQVRRHVDRLSQVLDVLDAS